MPPSSFLLDVLHIYWSNGVCSWEVNCLYWLDQEHGVGDLAEFLSLDWKTSPPCSPSYRKTIGHESNFVGASYKGSAAILQAFLPLYHYFLERCFGTGNDHKDKMESLRALRRITMELRQLSHSTQIATEKLQSLQQKHQKLCKTAWGDSHMKPKHHARFHLAQQMERFQLYLSCNPGEKKHKMYKSHIGLHRYDPWARGARNLHGAYSHLCLRQIFAHHLESLSKHQFADTLIGKTWKDDIFLFSWPSSIRRKNPPSMIQPQRCSK